MATIYPTAITRIAYLASQGNVHSNMQFTPDEDAEQEVEEDDAFLDDDAIGWRSR